MAVIDLLALPDALPRGAAIVGLDLGEKTIGVAVSDVSHLVATPAQTLKRAKFTRDAGALFALMAERGAAGLVIGLPVNMDGTEGPSSQSARAFARNLLRLRDLPIAFWDERLSTVAVTRALIDEADLSRSKRAAAVDKLAAAWILQGALDRLRAAKRDPTTAL
ncbi:MAG TPA: Holliday junction resolvase RuvX [Caulobacteraceae bacterium]|jgi:putative Holliday junction resolvase